MSLIELLDHGGNVNTNMYTEALENFMCYLKQNMWEAE